MTSSSSHHGPHVGHTLQTVLFAGVVEVEAKEHALLARVNEVLQVPDLGLAQLVLDKVVAVGAGSDTLSAGADQSEEIYRTRIDQ